MRDSFKTVRRAKRIEHRVKDSRFFATLSPVRTQKEAYACIERVREELLGASHHVYAFNVIEGGRTIARESDDGEPAGSSGPPLARVLKGSGLNNVIIIVTRYFGGTKLGLGGLARAYSQAGKLALDEGEIIEIIPLYSLEVEVTYNLLGEVLKAVDRFAKIKDVGHRGGGALVKASIKGRDLESLKRDIKDASRGQAKLYVEEEREL